MKATLAIGAVLAVVAACGSGSPSPTPPAVTAPPTLASASPAPSPTVTAESAARAYLSLADAANKADTANAKRCKGNLTLAPFRACYQRDAQTEYTFYTKLNSMAVPAQFEADKRALVKASSNEYVYDRELATVKSFSGISSLQAKLNAAVTATAQAANTLRLDLGLPPVPLN
jgi:hypothetical protein